MIMNLFKQNDYTKQDAVFLTFVLFFSASRLVNCNNSFAGQPAQQHVSVSGTWQTERVVFAF